MKNKPLEKYLPNSKTNVKNQFKCYLTKFSDLCFLTSDPQDTVSK